MARIYRTCADCEHEFYISEKDQIFFSNRCTCGHNKHQHDPSYTPSCEACDCEFFTGLEFPKRCFGCRKKSKIAAQEMIAQQQSPNEGAVEFFTEDNRHWSDKHDVRNKGQGK